MSFLVECDGVGGLVLFDRSWEVYKTAEFVSSLSFLLDIHGETQLCYDFPGEPWTESRARESKLVRTLCEQGNMAIIMLPQGDHSWHLEAGKAPAKPSMWVRLETGQLVGVSANELAECGLYPELEMEILAEMALLPGWHQFSIVEDSNKIVCTPCDPPAIPLGGNILFEKNLS